MDAAEKAKTDPKYRPYCLKCSTMARMEKTDYGFKCVACGNKINPDMTHFNEQIACIAQVLGVYDE